MKKDDSFFINLFKLKTENDFDLKEEFDDTKKSNNVPNDNENEWFQEYEVIYQSYSIG
jgi:hypothetical protein